MSALTVTAPAGDPDERPTDSLPIGQLVRLSLYWLGLSSIFAGLSAILAGRLEFERLVPAGTEGSALFQMTVFGAVIAAIVQPTVGSLSDYTVSRWGRRKPYIVLGSILDIAFLVGIAISSTVVTIAAFVALLQVSANMAQGPFQGYVPDLVPARQVGLASALVGLFQILGNVTGFAGSPRGRVRPVRGGDRRAGRDRGRDHAERRGGRPRGPCREEPRWPVMGARGARRMGS